MKTNSASLKNYPNPVGQILVQNQLEAKCSSAVNLLYLVKCEVTAKIRIIVLKT